MTKYCLLTNYICIQVQGSKALDLLQGQLTNNVYTNNKSLFCNIKGRIIAMLEIIHFDNSIYLVMNKELWPKTHELLLKVALLSKVVFEEKPAINIYATLDDKFYLSSQLPEITSLDQISYEQWHLHRIKQQKFELYSATIGLFLPHDLNLIDNWIDFAKGCYRGQEIIARMHYRAKSKYHLALIENKDLSALQPGEKLDDMSTVIDKHDNLILVCTSLHNQAICYNNGY